MGTADLHAHTCHDGWGDGNQKIQDLFQHVEEETDLDIFGITDHDNADTARAAWELYQHGDYRFGFLPGVEVTNQGGHLLCFFPTGDVFDVPSLRPFWWTVRYAQERGAVCVVAHPIYPPWLPALLTRGVESGARVDGIETVNAALGERAQRRLDGIVEKLPRGVAQVGNSDAHDVCAIGAAHTRFPGHTVEDLLHALREDQTEAVLVRQPQIASAARSFTNRRSMTRPGWVRNLWREARGQVRTEREIG
jgi:predicted metal-dependent phosphoesterase TrpH